MPIDMSAAKAPPRKTPTPRAAKVTPVVESQTAAERRRDGLLGLGQMAQGGLVLTGQYADAAAVGQHFHPIATEVANIAEDNDSVAKVVDLIIAVGPYGALVSAVLPFAMQIAANHKWIDPSALMGQGVVPPEVLDAQMRARIAKMQLDAQKAQHAAIQEAQQAQKEFDAYMAEAKAA